MSECVQRRIDLKKKVHIKKRVNIKRKIPSERKKVMLHMNNETIADLLFICSAEDVSPSAAISSLIREAHQNKIHYDEP